MAKIETYNDGEGVTTVAWIDADFNPVEAGSSNAKYVKMIASTGEMSFFHVEQERELEFNEEDHPRDDHGKFTSGGGDSSAKEESRSKLSSGKVTDKETITGSINSVQKITLKDDEGNEVEAIFKPESGESWTSEEASRNQVEAHKQQHGLNTEEFDEQFGSEFGYGDDEPTRETITNRDFSFADREAAAYELDETLGLNVVPPTIVREIDGKRGMVQEFVETNGLGASDTVDQDSVYGIAVLDIATGNTDRHAGNILIDTNRRVVAIDQGLSFPDDTEYHPNYQFRPDATLSLLASNQGPMSSELADRIGKSLETTDWEKVSGKWKMSDGERDGFLGRINRLKTVFSTPDSLTRSYGVRSLIASMAKESNIAGHVPDDVRHIDTDHLGTEISK